MPPSGQIAFAESVGFTFALFGATIAWDGIVRRHIRAENLTIGRIDLRGWRARAVGIVASLFTLGCFFMLFSVVRRVFQACQSSVTCSLQSSMQALATSAVAVGIFLFGIFWFGFWLWRTRPDGYVRQWIGSRVYLDEGEVVERVQRALAKQGYASVDEDLLMRIMRGLNMRLTPIAFQRDSSFVEDGHLVVHRFVSSTVNSAFGNRFGLPKPQLQIILTAITEYYVEIGERARKPRMARSQQSDG